MSDVPEGFEPFFRSSPYLDLIGPLHCRNDDGGLVLGLRIDERHVNNRGVAHGGLLVTLADIALGYSALLSKDPPVPLTTVHLSTDFAHSAKVGDWVEVHTEVQHVGRSVAFANCYLSVNGVRIARASAVFTVAAGQLPAAGLARPKT